MKTTRIRFLAAALIGSSIIYTVNAEKIQFEQLPIDLKDKIRVHAGSARVEDVDRQTKGGKTTYEVGFKKNGEHTELMFNDRGELIQPASGTAALDSRKISYNELPEIVKKAADARLKNAEVNDVDRMMRDGRATYEIGFKQNGQQQELVISQDGRILNDSPSAEAVGAAGATVIGRGSSSATSLVPEPVTLSSSRKMELSQAPAAVQKAVTAAANGAKIEDFERGTWQGRNVYQAAFKENGRHIELQVREDGKILHDPRKTGTGSAVRGARSPYASVTSLVPLSSTEKLDREELPVTVERRLNAHIGKQRIEDIERGTWQGKTVYQVAFKDAQGQHVELQLDENGTVVYDPRTKR